MRRPPRELAQRLIAASAAILDPTRVARLEDVVQITAIPRATLYYYFSGRDDLVAFLLESHLAQAADTLAEPARLQSDPVRRLRATIAALVDFLADEHGVCAALLSVTGATNGFADLMAAKDAALAAPLCRVLEEGVTNQAFTVGNCRDTANAILGGAMIATLSRSASGLDIDDEFRRNLTDQLIRGVSAS